MPRDPKVIPESFTSLPFLISEFIGSFQKHYRDNRDYKTRDQERLIEDFLYFHFCITFPFDPLISVSLSLLLNLHICRGKSKERILSLELLGFVYHEVKRYKEVTGLLPSLGSSEL